MEQEEIIGQLKKHLRLWRTIAWVLTALMICATVALFLLWQKLEKEKHPETPEEPLPTSAFCITNADERIADTTRLLEIAQDSYLWLALCDIYNAYVINSDLRGFSWSRSGQPAYWNLYWTE